MASRRLKSRSASSIDFDGGGKDESGGEGALEGWEVGTLGVKGTRMDEARREEQSTYTRV